jgi:hypothetical protein
MLCAEFDRRLQRRLDRREPPQADRRLIRHARRCAACRQMLAMQTLIAEQLTVVPRPLPPPRFTARILARFGRESGPMAGRFMIGRLAGAALAATLILSAWPLAKHWPAGFSDTDWFSTPSSSKTSSASKVLSSPEANSQAASTQAAPPTPSGAEPRGSSDAITLSRPVADDAVRQRFQLLAAETGQGLAAVVLRLPGVGGEPSPTDAASQAGDSPWVEDLTGRLKPFAASLSDALGPWLESASPDERSPRS